MEFSPIFCTQAKNMMFLIQQQALCVLSHENFFSGLERWCTERCLLKRCPLTLCCVLSSQNIRREKNVRSFQEFLTRESIFGGCHQNRCNRVFQTLGRLQTFGITMATSGIIKLGINLPQNLPSYQFVRDRSLILRYEKLYEMRCYEILVT